MTRSPLCRTRSLRLIPRSLVVAAIALSGLVSPAHSQDREILNVSHDIARELYAALNPVFADQG